MFSTDYICKCLVLVGDFSEDTYAGKTKLENFLENFKSSLRNGDSSLGVPVLDPFITQQLFIIYNQNTPSNIKCVSALFLK